ncbi:kinetochore protein Spc24 isoform X5 [Canis lupus familiaris]|uniref:kinetochore protein Spc24 isoform X1 n=2 Tax=Canis lupus familiaris TaxID=9615 RepID=UPI000DC687D3|nr:kinetochore protein Spc24 isoform X1 [Canis lupus familiaris]XP_038311786.1 kinetochore protein Spc24 isoform X5 [Canis lupus familiaris]XP_038311787.1 kinetochore protein Spc24 isoform X5 [Canis lupus familiaris]XP_038423181.1 kinetochore protein Spc24 isoform X1 [Canis lupus familiaris]
MDNTVYVELKTPSNVLAIYGEYKMQSLVRGRKRKNDSFSAGRAVMEAWRVSSCPRRALPRSLEDWVQECPIGRSTVASHRGQAATLEAESRRNWQQQRPKQEILATEEEVAQCLLDAKAQAHQRGVELQQLKAELQKAGEENTHLKASLLQLTTELEELKEVEAGLERQEREVDEDTTVTIPSAVYVAQLYHRVSKIEWDYECEPGMVKGIHHGPSIAQPIHLDSTQLSKKFISDYLWNLVDTDW